MDIQVNQADFNDGLEIVKRALPRSTTLYILNFIKFATQGDALTMQATNLTTTISVRIPATVHKPADATGFALPGALLSEYVAALPVAPMTITDGKTRPSATVTCERYTSTLVGADTDDFPKLPFLDAAPATATVDADSLVAALRKVIGSASKDDNRPVLGGIYFEHGKKGTNIVSADGFRLSVAPCPGFDDPATPKEFKWIVPASVVKELIALLSRKNDTATRIEIRVATTGNQVQFNGVNWTLATRLVEGQFPDYTQIVPKTHTMRVTVERDPLTAAARAVALFAAGNSRVMRLTGQDDWLTLAANAAEIGDTEVKMEASVEVQGTFVVDAKYFLDALTGIDRNNLVIEQEASDHPIVVHGEGSTAYTVIMPMSMINAQVPGLPAAYRAADATNGTPPATTSEATEATPTRATEMAHA